MNHEIVRIRWLQIGVLLVVLLAVLPRVINLGDRPLGPEEAVQALNATRLSPEPATFWPTDQEGLTASPLYEWLTGLVFQFGGSGRLQARLVPALAGTLLAVLPLFFMQRASRSWMLLTAGLLALSPVAINLSRMAAGDTLSVLFLTAAIMNSVLPVAIEERERQSIWTAILLGASLASGRAVYTGIFSLLFTYALIRWRMREALRSGELAFSGKGFVHHLWIVPVTAVLVATGVGGFRFGLAGLGEALVLWLRGWVPFGQLSALGFLVAGLTYEPLLVVVGTIGAVLAWRRSDTYGKAFSLWALASFLTVLIYPGRSAQDWIWAAVPLAVLAASTLSLLLQRISQREKWLHVVSLVSIAIVLISAAAVTLLGYVNGYLQQMLMGDDVLIALALFAMLLLLASVFVLFGLGWSWSIVLDGAGIVVVAVTFLLSVSAAWNLGSDRGLGFRTLWVPSSPTQNGQYLEDTIENASLALTGDANAAPIFVQGEPEPGLIWALRNYPRYEPVEAENATAPPILIVPDGADLGAYSAEYFGQSFALNLERGWFGLVPPDLLRWSLTHSAPTASTSWVVFIRSDIIRLSDFSTEPALE